MKALAILLGVLLLVSCVSYRDRLDEAMRQTLEADKLHTPLRQELEVYLEKGVLVHLVGDCSGCPCKQGSIGCARGSEIWVVATERDGKIYPNQMVLGHEVQHLLERTNRKVANPDD